MNDFQLSVCNRARREVVIGSCLLVTTMTAFVLFFAQNYLNSRGIIASYLPGTGAERVVYNCIFAIFMYGSFTYQVSRLAFFWNVRSRVSAAEESLERFIQSGKAAAPPIEILVPSYKEEKHVIWQTLMSAALIDYPNRRIVLLLDDPPFPRNTEDAASLSLARAQIGIIADELEPFATEFSAAVAQYRAIPPADINIGAKAAEAASLYDKAATLLSGLALKVNEGRYGGADDHTRKFFVERILLEPASRHKECADRLRHSATTHDELEAAFDRLDYMFRVSLSAFERKKYVNFSHAPTKAANLNSYISVMGRRLEVQSGDDGLKLIDLEPNSPVQGAVIAPPDADYIVVLDADSFLLPNYATCMISAIQRPENKQVAVMQTPYTSIPGSPYPIERAAAATTDIYYYVTEGMSFVRAGSWIGAAAVIRKQALLDVVVTEDERGYSFPVYIQDKTVIEDTDATIDLARKGWTVQNYPDRLSYSATPSDFGALVVQRRRWANGGLIILPNLLRYLAKVRPNFGYVLEALLRIHYLVMPACISISMLLMLIYPFDFKRVSSWIYLTLPPYLYLVMRDLAHTGYRRSEILKAYTLFLILLPVVLAGVKNSLLQIVYGQKSSFGRTPKVDHRTAVPATYLLAIIGLLVWSLLTAYGDFTKKNEMHAVFAVSNAVALGYGLVVLVGLKETVQDLLLAMHPMVWWATRANSGAASSSALVPAGVAAIDHSIPAQVTHRRHVGHMIAAFFRARPPADAPTRHDADFKLIAHDGLLRSERYKGQL